MSIVTSPTIPWRHHVTNEYCDVIISSGGCPPPAQLPGCPWENSLKTFSTELNIVKLRMCVRHSAGSHCDVMMWRQTKICDMEEFPFFYKAHCIHLAKWYAGAIASFAVWISFLQLSARWRWSLFWGPLQPSPDDYRLGIFAILVSEDMYYDKKPKWCLY